MKCLCLCKCACECMCVCITITYLLSCEWYYAPFTHWLSCSIYLCHLFCDSISSWRAGYEGQSGKLRWGLYSCPVARLQSPISKRQARSGCHGNLSRVKGEWRCGGSAMTGFCTNKHTHTHTCMRHTPWWVLYKTKGVSGINGFFWRNMNLSIVLEQFKAKFSLVKHCFCTAQLNTLLNAFLLSILYFSFRSTASCATWSRDYSHATAININLAQNMQ